MMRPHLTYSGMLPLIILVLGGLLGGVINGLLGTGGGIVLTYALAYVLRGDGFSAKDRFVSAMAAILPISVISLTTYSSEYLRDPSYLLCLITPSALGGLTGAYLSTKVKAVFLEKIFALLVIYAGIKMML